MYIFGIESSCDDTSVALLDCSDKGHLVVSSKTISQIDVHAKYGGVVPEIAGRMHAEKIVPLIEAALENQPKPDVIAVTAGPGLITGLLVGVESARTLSYASNIPLIAVNHIEGHIHSVEIASPEPKFIQLPALCLIVSGGHTELILMSDHGEYRILGRTKDDAAGECFDKVAKLIGFSYPGGPHISKLAVGGRTDAISFPRPMLEQDNFDFSFAGLKTAALYWLRDHQLTATPTSSLSLPAGVSATTDASITINDFCASFEQAIIDVLVGKTLRAAWEYKPASIVLAGGVAANKKLRETLTQEISRITPYSLFLIPPWEYCMDNGAMIAVTGYYHARKNRFSGWRTIDVHPNWRIDAMR